MKNLKFKWLLLSIILSVAGISQVWAWTFTNAHVYFDNTNSNWTSDESHGVQFWPEKSAGSAGLLMTPVDGTKLFYWGGSWSNGDISYYRFASTNNVAWDWQDKKTSWAVLENNVNCYGISDMASSGNVSADNCIALYVSGSGTYNNTSAVRHASESNPANLVALNSTQTIESWVDEDDGTGYNQANSKAIISISSYELTAHGETTNRTPELSTSEYEETVSACRTAETTLSVGAVATGYIFDGWYNGSNSLITASTTYTYRPTAATTIRARFHKEEIHDITVYYKCSGVEIGEGHYTEEAVGVATTREISAPPIDEYVFTSWTCGTHVTNTDASTDETIDIKSVTCSSSCDFTITANYTKLTRLSYTNPDGWSNIYAYVWDGSGNNTWPGVQIKGGVTDNTTTINCKTVYYFEFNPTTRAWANIIFNNGLSGEAERKTGDLTIADNDDKYFNGSKWTGTLTDYTVSVATAASHLGTVSGGGKVREEGCTATITATPKPGYRFNSWSVTSGTALIANASSAETTVTASSNATITASFTNSGMVYFDRSAVNGVWSGDKVYMTCFNSTPLEWHSSNGSLTVKNWVNDAVHNVEMTKIPNTSIYYFDCTGYTASISKILFCDKSHPHPGGNNYFVLQGMGAVVEETVNLSYDNMFVAENFNWKTKNNVGYCDGYWMKYNETNSGLELRVYDEAGTELTAAPVSSPVYFTTLSAGDREFTASVTLSAATTYRFKVKGWNGLWYTNNGSMSSTNCTSWPFYYRTPERVQNTDCYITTTGVGTYKFFLSCTNSGVLRVTVEYPLEENDYRLVYKGKIKDGASANAHPSDFIRHLREAGTQKDTVSFYVREDWSLQLQKCTGFTGSTANWGDEGDAISKASLGITENGVYTFLVEQTHDGSSITVSITKIGTYTGDYYIRSSASGGGWEAYETTADNKLSYSDYAKAHSGYDYYSCHYVNTGTNVKFTIANDYSSSITDTVENDTYVTSYGNLPYEANVRFMYNNETNKISRDYLNGSHDGTADYLYIQAKQGAGPVDSIKYANGTAIAAIDGINQVKFNDNGNWIYELDIKALEGTHVRLISNYRFSDTDHLQYFKGNSSATWNSASTEQIIGGSTADSWQTLRIIYDFKTNHLLSAWLADGTDVSTPKAIYADVMIVREAQEDAKQITFSGTGSLTDVDTVYAVMKFNKWTLNNKSKDGEHPALLSELSRYERDLYWVSFPFDVNLNDVFGFGTYGTHWIMERYDGKTRAKNGFWADSPSNWKFITPYQRDSGWILNANEGYILALDLDVLGESSSVWNYVEDVYLYFPSKDKVGNIKKTDVKVDIDQDGYECTIGPRFAGGDDRTIKDSYWHCIGIPSFADVTHNINTGWTTDQGENSSVVDAGDYPNRTNWTSKDLPYLYEWNPDDNTLTPIATEDYEFKAMWSYLVQYNNDTIWWKQIPAPSASVIARVLETPDENFKLSLYRNEKEEDHTFVKLTDNANVTTAFEFNHDLSKEMNKNRGNIWTVTTDSVEVAGNSQPHPLTTTVVPVGVKVVANGEYTFSMPEGTNGGDVWLIDNANSSRTNLGLMDYTVNLTTGTYEGRFSLEFPVQNVVTEIENAANANANANADIRKVFVGGRLYILRDGKAYDATGAQVR